jgi:hypothetical protein
VDGLLELHTGDRDVVTHNHCAGLVSCVAWRGGIAGFIRCPRGPRHAIGAGQPSARAGVAWRLALLGAAVGTDVARGVATGRGADSQLVYYPW